jgi:CRISPR-associated endonuclease Cas1
MDNYHRCNRVPHPSPLILEHLVNRVSVYVENAEKLIIEDDHLIIPNVEYAQAIHLLKDIDTIIIFGDTLLPQEYIRLTIKNRISTVFFETGGSLLTRIDPPERESFYEKQLKISPEIKFQVASSAIYQVIANDLSYLQRSARESTNRSDESNEYIKRVIRDIRISLSNFYQNKNPNQLMGTLGVNKRRYYSCIPHLLVDKWLWRGIKGNLPIAKMLKFTYDLWKEITAVSVVAAGLNCDNGFRQIGRNGLVKDLSFEFRHLCEKAVVATCNRQQIVAKDFDGNYNNSQLPSRVRSILTQELKRTLARKFKYPELKFPTTYHQAISIQIGQYKMLLNSQINDMYFIKSS